MTTVQIWDWVVPKASGGLRLDLAIAAHSPHFSRRRAKVLIGDGVVFIDGQRIKTVSKIVKAGNRITLHDGPRQSPAPINVLYTDDEFVVVDKPSGHPTDPTTQGSAGTVADALRSHLGFHGSDFLASCHRLDVETTGALMFAKTPDAAARAGAAFRESAVSRTYIAVVHGRPSEGEHIFDSPIDDSGALVTLAAHGKPSRTIAHVVALVDVGAVLLVKPETGRRHQIRAHLAGAGHALVGDRKYGVAAERGVFGLHAYSLATGSFSTTPTTVLAPPSTSLRRAYAAVLGGDLDEHLADVEKARHTWENLNRL